MKRLLLFSLFFTFLASYKIVFPQITLNQVLDYQFDAMKQDKFNKLKTITIIYDVVKNNKNGTLKMIFKRNDKLRIEEVFNNVKTVKAYNGLAGWEQLTDTSKPRLLEGKQLEEIKFMADLDGYFFCWREKNHELKLIGKEKLNGENVFKILCTKKNGDNADLYLNTKTFLLTKAVQHINMNGKIVTNETNYEKYRKVNGIPFPYQLSLINNGVIENQKVKSITLDEKIPDSIFNMP